MPQYARWMSPWDRYRMKMHEPHGIICGSYHGRLLYHNGPEHCLVVASTQSGKTSSFVYPNLLTRNPQSVIVHDPKEEIYQVTAGWRRTFSKVINLAPVSPTTDGYNPLDAIRLRTDQEVRDAQLLAEMLTEPDQDAGARPSGAEKHFMEMAQYLLYAMALYGLYTQQATSLGALYRIFATQQFGEFLQTLRGYPHPAIQLAGGILQQVVGRDERSGIVSTTLRALALYADPLIDRATRTSAFRMKDLRERGRPLSLYLSIPFGDQERLRPWTRLVLRQLLDYAVSKKEGWRWKVLAMIDEVPGLKKLNILTDGLNYFAGYGVRLALITPSMKELIKVYTQYHNFLDGCHVQIAFGLRDPQIAQTFSDSVGMHEKVTWRRSGKGSMRDTKLEPLLSQTALMRLKPHQQLLLVGAHRLICRKPYYLDYPHWKARSQYG